MTSTTSFVGCQPIFDVARRAVAYELLFRDSEANRAVISSPDSACATTLLAALADIGLDELIGAGRGFVNIAEGILFGPHLEGLPKDRVTLEILEDVPPTPAVIARVRELSAMGFQIALDDFVMGPAYRPLLEIADIVKVDVLAVGVARAAELAGELRPFGVTLLAEKVESEEVLEQVKAAGYTLFQGYYFCRPKVVKASRLSASRVTALRLVAALQQPDLHLEQLETLIRADVALSVRLLRCANASSTRRARRIESVRDAARLLGLPAVRSLASLLALSGEDGAQTSELLLTSVTRARMCELLAEVAAVPPNEAFTAGLFSLLDALMGVAMSAIVDQLQLGGNVREALLERGGPSGALLSRVEDYERVVRDGAVPPARELAAARLAALRWSRAALAA